MSIVVLLVEEKSMYALNMSDMFDQCNYEAYSFSSFQKASEVLRDKERRPKVDVFLLSVYPESEKELGQFISLLRDMPDFAESQVFLICAQSEDHIAKRLELKCISKPVRQKAIEDLVNIVPVKGPTGKVPEEESMRVIRDIGQGAAGLVKLVENLVTRQKFAMKIINFEQLSEKDREKAKDEIVVLKVMDCPNIIKYCHSTNEKNRILIYMEYAECGSLYEQINEKLRMGGRFPIQQILDYCAQITLALEYIQEKGLLHRDIKPQNIFLASNKIVKLGDFGISKLLGAGDLASTYVGTPYYMAPEIIRKQAYDSRADIWSFGCVFYQLCYLDKPFRGDSEFNIYNQIIESTPEYSTEVPEPLNQLIGKMLQKDPAKRISIHLVAKHPLIRRAKKEFIKRLEKHCPKTFLSIKCYNILNQDQAQLLQVYQQLTKKIFAQARRHYQRMSLFQSQAYYLKAEIDALLAEEGKDKDFDEQVSVEKLVFYGFFQERTNGILIPFCDRVDKPFYCKNQLSPFCAEQFDPNSSKQLLEAALSQPEKLKIFRTVQLGTLRNEARPGLLLNLWRVLKFHKVKRETQNRRSWLGYFKSLLSNQFAVSIILPQGTLSLEELEDLMLDDPGTPTTAVFYFADHFSQEQLKKAIPYERLQDECEKQAREWCRKYLRIQDQESEIRISQRMQRFQKRLGLRGLLGLLLQHAEKPLPLRVVWKDISQKLMRVTYIDY